MTGVNSYTPVMTGTYRGLRRSVAVLACLVAVLLAATPAPGEPSRPPLRVLQLNLCGSGYAGCYTGRATLAAGATIRTLRPDVVTLNEICADDVTDLARVVDELYPGHTVVRAFHGAYDRRTGSPFQCLNGRGSYGNGLIVRLPASKRAHTIDGGLYPAQDFGDPEERSWVCVHVPGAFQACTTHLANTSPAVALAQCEYLLGTAAPGLRARGGYEPTVVAGDLNLLEDHQPSVRSCVPAGHLRRSDGAVQHVIATGDYAFTTTSPIDMSTVTDHPGLLVGLATAPRT
jgi:endonuclease/exonuclease/phosphatase family metal-dependent hydrolase